MNIIVWILSVLLAVAFVGAGAAKLVTPRTKLLDNPRMAWASDFTDVQVKVIAGLEVLGGIAVILPWLLDIAPVLTPLAAAGLALLMMGALVTHARRGELKEAIPVNGLLIAVAVIVAVVRFTQL